MDGSRLADGAAQIREVYGAVFDASPDFHAEIRSRMVVGDLVVDDELVTGVVLEGYPSEMRSVAAYRVAGGRITAVMLMPAAAD